MGASRETWAFYAAFKTVYRGSRWRQLKRGLNPQNFSREWWDDTFGPIICWLVGHQPYQSDVVSDPNEWACHCCHRYLPRVEVRK